MFIFKNLEEMLVHINRQMEQAEKLSRVTTELKRDQWFNRGRGIAFREVVEYLSDFIKRQKEKESESCG